MANITTHPVLRRTLFHSSFPHPPSSTLRVHRHLFHLRPSAPPAPHHHRLRSFTSSSPRPVLPHPRQQYTYFPEAAAKAERRLKLFAFISIAGIAFFAGAFEYYWKMRDFIAYTDEESLTQFKPADSHQAEIEEFISTHPIAQELRKNPAYTESRPTLKIKEQFRNASLTSGALAGPGRIVVPPYVWVEEDGKSLVSIMYLGSEVCGYPGLIHGGVLATLLDEGLARCSFAALPNKLAMTASLTVNYRKPSPAESYVVLRAKTTKVEGRKAWVEGHIETLPKKEGEEPVVLVEANALMIEPRQAEGLTRLVGNP